MAAVAALAIAHVSPARASCDTHRCWRRVHRHRRLAWARGHPWLHARHQLPRWGVLMLERLGPGCETYGKPDSVGYRLRTDDAGGPHRGRYQYLDDTWRRTIAYLPPRLRRHATSGPAYRASPAEQDVRTFYFYPSHRGEWQCRA